MAVSPEQGLRAWVEYLRDMGVYDLYRRDEVATVLPVALRERFAASSVSVSARQAERLSTDVPEMGAVPPKVATSSRPAAVGADARGKNPRLPVAPLSARPPAVPNSEPATNYFSTEAEVQPQALPPELAAPMPKPQPLETLFPPPATPLPATARAKALEQLRAEIGDCTRCPLAYAGRHNIVFGAGDPNARLMFVGEGPGADEDATGQPFIGKAGQLLNNMIAAMGLTREGVFISNIVKCRPPGNRVPEFVEATTCSQFLLRQIDIVRPEVIVALGATAAAYVLGVRQSLSSLRGQWYAARGAKVAVTFHPAFLLRDPRQKAEAWKDLQVVMGELGLQVNRKG